MNWRFLLPVLGLLLALSGCSLNRDGDGQAALNGGWTISSSADGSLELAHPSGWRLVERGERALSLEWEGGYLLEIRLVVASRPTGQSQAEVLNGMLAAAEEQYRDAGGQIEPAGRRVWLGQSFIWHEVHYVARAGDACRECQSGYVVELLAFPNEAESLYARFVCPSFDPPGEEVEQLLLDVINTVALEPPGST